MIPAQAVEAAAKAYRDQQSELGYPKWEDLPEDGREWRRGYMRAALEAAAPHMLADAWQRGNRAALGRDNPYRSAK